MSVLLWYDHPDIAVPRDCDGETRQSDPLIVSTPVPISNTVATEGQP